MKTLYLDSSDISHLSQSELNETYKEVECLLVNLTQERKLKCVYSAVHIAELMQRGTLDEESAFRRAAILRRFCGTNVLTDFLSIVNYETKSAMSGITEKVIIEKGRRSQIRKDGIWFSTRDGPILSNESDRENIDLRFGGNRKERRRKSAYMLKIKAPRKGRHVDMSYWGVCGHQRE